ncbi:Integrase, catalytic core protein [Phytophthora megakarya]|uniref:Integrase, catalytic core protein n=1 Tax=Phytophthora megakarya TaxID=4795 RepID=A0A225VSY8_9STRA|nr:Integrase, catalytic core protein [Phytophthora megakarya]
MASLCMQVVGLSWKYPLKKSQKTPNSLPLGGYARSRQIVKLCDSLQVADSGFQSPPDTRDAGSLAAVLHLYLCGGDFNTAYLNALLEIRHYLKNIDWFTCAIKGHMYVVLNRWFLNQGYLRSLTEPCLYNKFEGQTITLVLIYVDDIMVAPNSEDHKCKLFEKLDVMYGIKDQGLLTEYLDIEVDQTDESRKYAREVLDTFGYENAHAVGNPMETNVRMVPLDANEESDLSFEYRKAIGMLT